MRSDRSIGPRTRRPCDAFGAMSALWRAIATSVIAIAFASAAAANATADNQRFQLSGYGTLTVDQQSQENGNIRLRAYLTPKDAAIAASPPLQEGGHFAMIAGLTAQSLVCYADTIFRNDFDADGG